MVRRMFGSQLSIGVGLVEKLLLEGCICLAGCKLLKVDRSVEIVDHQLQGTFSALSGITVYTPVVVRSRPSYLCLPFIIFR